LKEEIKPGQLVIIDNFIDRTTKRSQTFYDGNDSLIGVCHIPMEPAMCPRTSQVVVEAARELGLEIHDKGTVVCIEGPRFSTKAESFMFRSWGADLVNMTTWPPITTAGRIKLSVWPM
jgi:5'-methylthioadenosine phosphorylase